MLNNNQKTEKLVVKKKLKKGACLITQKRYNGKGIDIALINVADINEIIGIQISICDNDIFTQEQIIDFLLNLRLNIYKYYDLEVNVKDIYFCYLFD